MIEPTPLGMGEGFSWLEEVQTVDEDQLEAGFFAKCRAGYSWPDRTVS